MPEAVIVSVARTPIGRANKGSLKAFRPDDLAVLATRAAFDKIPELDPATIDDYLLGCELPGGESGNNMGRNIPVLMGYDGVPGTTITRYCSSSVQTTRMAYHAIKAGEGDIFVSAGVETVSRFAKGTSDHWPDTHNPAFADAEERTKAYAEGGLDWHDPRQDDLLPNVYIAMGQTAENVAHLRGIKRRQANLSGEFGEGDKLPTESDLAGSFGVSRPTVREALQSLVTAGLIDKVSGVSGGSFVRSVNHYALGRTMRESMANILQLGTIDIQEVHAMRRLLEPPGARLASLHREDKHLEAMAEVIDRQRSTTLDDPDIPELDQRFHTAIAEASGNRLLSAFVSSLHTVSQPVRYLELTPEVGRCMVRQHMAIQRSIERHDEQSAQDAMIEHLDYALLNSSSTVEGPN